MGKRLIIIKILVYIVLAYILIFNIGTLLETHMIHKEYMACLYDFDYKPSIQHTQFWCKTNIFIIIMIALFFVIFQTKRSRCGLFACSPTLYFYYFIIISQLLKFAI